MKLNLMLITLLLLLSGCASTGNQQQGQIQRITPEELAKLMPDPVATVSLDEIVLDSQQGKTPEEIIEKIKASDSQYALTTTQVLALNKQGVHIKVLDYIQQRHELAKQNAMAEEINRREQEKAEAKELLLRERLRNDRYYWGPRYHLYYGAPIYGRHWRGSRFGWGMSFGHPFWW